MDNTDDKTPVYLRKFTTFTRVQLWIRIWFIKLGSWLVLKVLELPGIRNGLIQPTYSKTYPVRPTLPIRVFIPKSYKNGKLLLPTFLDIHGGGFALMSPMVDDEFCSEFSNKNNVLVVSLDYLKSPQYKFPAPNEGLLDLIHAVLADESLPINPKKVAIGGFSAGGNYALSVSQYPSLRGKIGAVVAYYPPVNFSVAKEISMAAKPKNAPPDILFTSVDMFNWGFLKPDQNLKDSMLSPAFAPRANLPPKIYIIGCEFDLLCRNAELMAEKVSRVGSEKERKGSEICWERNGVKWEKIIAEEHAFDTLPRFQAEVRAQRNKRRLEMHESVAEWLFREAWN